MRSQLSCSSSDQSWTVTGDSRRVAETVKRSGIAAVHAPHLTLAIVMFLFANVRLASWSEKQGRFVWNQPALNKWLRDGTQPIASFLAEVVASLDEIGLLPVNWCIYIYVSSLKKKPRGVLYYHVDKSLYGPKDYKKVNARAIYGYGHGDKEAKLLVCDMKEAGSLTTIAWRNGTGIVIPSKILQEECGFHHAHPVGDDNTMSVVVDVRPKPAAAPKPWAAAPAAAPAAAAAADPTIGFEQGRSAAGAGWYM